MPTVDNLDIQIKSSAESADKALNKLVGTIGKISASLGGLNFNNFANGVKNLSTAMNGLQNVKMPDYNRLAKGIEKLGSINSTQIQQAGVAIKELSGSLRYLDSINVSDNSKQIAELANGISKLGYKSTTQAIQNIPQLATAMKQLMATLSTAPRVSQNIIDMTNALANLSRTGASSGRTANSLSKSLNAYTTSTHKASKGTWSLASAFGKMYASYFLLFRLFGKIGDAIDISSSLTEVQNVVDVTFGEMSSKVEEFTQNSIEQFGMSELSAKQFASQFQAMGTAMGIDSGAIGSANTYLNGVTKGYVGLSDSMADVSLNLTKLTADMASFYNVDQKDVAEDLTAIFTGQTRPMRQYGIDLTQATLKEWAMKQGLDANIESMTQAEKTMLRYQYVLANTGAAQGDFARTSDTWANQVRILKQNFEQLGSVIGGTFINMLKPLVKALNNVMSHIIAFAQTVSDALGKIFGWKYEVGGGGVTNDLETGAGAADDIASGMGAAADSAKKLKDYTLGIDELNIISPDTDSVSGGGSSGGVEAGGASGSGGQWVEQKSMLEEYMSEIDTLYELGNYIRDALIGAMESIDWDAVYEKARGFGSGLAEFLNGLFEGEKGTTLFGEVGSLVAGALNTVVYSALSFAQTFDFYQFGANLADGINTFFKEFDFEDAAEGLNEFVDGLKEALQGFLETLTWEDIISGIGDFLGTLELDTVEILIGAFWIKNTNLKSLLWTAITKKTIGGVSLKNIPLFISSFSLANIGTPAFDVIGNQIWDGISDALAKLLPDWAFDFLSNLGVGIVLGAVGGSWFPGAGTVAGAIIGGIIGALEGIKIDGESILSIIAGKLFNFSDTLSLAGYASGLFERLKEDFENQDWLSIGKDILLGIVSVLATPVTFVAEPFADLLAWIWDGICGIFGINSPAEEMKPLGEYILLGIVEGFSAKFEEFTTVFTEFWDNYIAPWFTVEKWFELFNGIYEGLLLKWEELTIWWDESAVSAWWDEDVAPWFTLEKWKTLFNNIKTSLVTKWTETVTAWKVDIKKWWDEDVAPWFTLEKWLDLLSKIPEAFKSSFKNAANGAIAIFNRLIDWINGKMHFSWDAITILGKEIVPAGSVQLFTIPHIPQFEAGGFPESASLFWAGENGVPEMLGTVGGQTAVASGAEITGIREAVYESGERQERLLVEAVSLLGELLNKDVSVVIGDKEIVQANKRGLARMGYSFT